MSNMTKGSLGELSQAANMGLAEAFMSADTIILVDTSGSMQDRDDIAETVGMFGTPQYGQKYGPTRYERACAELIKLQANLSGRIAVMSFSSHTVYCPGGVPDFLQGGTNIAEALRFVHIADGVVDRFVLISDGEPQEPEAALAEARKFTTPISTIFIGSEGGPGQAFLKRLADASGGTAQTIQQAGLLAEKIEVLMLTAA
jgi:hypothetical protein